MVPRTAFSVLLLAACTAPINRDPPAPEGLAERFELVAFYDEATGAELPLRRWEEPIVIQIGQANARPHRAAALNMIATLDRLTPISVTEKGEGEFANVLLLIGTREEMEELSRLFPDYDVSDGLSVRFDCAAFAFPGLGLAPYEIGAAFVMIDSESLDAGGVRRCLAQELTQALGLMNDMDDPQGTVFSSRSRRQSLSPSDELLVRILYDRRLAAGMTRAEAMPIVRQITEELQAGPPIN